MRLISSATVKKEGGRKEGRGVQTLVAQLVLMTFHMQHPGSAANITNAPSQLGSDAMRDEEVEAAGGLNRKVRG